ncbi:MAG TPA: hypothetical protein VN703_03785 [Candidatus Sulfopaludibacter sp.]|jgi:hypothetical protein|nr:hypothetical protein [Candidatus Sulfopaludibacter sp.]
MHIKEIVQKGLIKEKKEKEKENQSMKVQWILIEKSNNILPITSMHYVFSFKGYSKIVLKIKKSESKRCFQNNKKQERCF